MSKEIPTSLFMVIGVIAGVIIFVAIKTCRARRQPKEEDPYSFAAIEARLEDERIAEELRAADAGADAVAAAVYGLHHRAVHYGDTPTEFISVIVDPRPPEPVRPVHRAAPESFAIPAELPDPQTVRQYVIDPERLTDDVPAPEDAPPDPVVAIPHQARRLGIHPPVGARPANDLQIAS